MGVIHSLVREGRLQGVEFLRGLPKRPGIPVELMRTSRRACVLVDLEGKMSCRIEVEVCTWNSRIILLLELGRTSKVTLRKKRSQEKSYEVRSVIFMPAFPWHQMGGKFSHKLVSTLSYLLYTCLCQEISKWFIFFLKFPICSPRMLCEQFQAICLIPLKLRHHVIMLYFEFPNAKFICSSLPLH